MNTLELLDRLIAFPTVSKDSNLELISWVEEFLRTAGFDVARIWSPDRRKAGLFARIGPATDGGICLSAHTDVVPVDGQDWTRPPFKLTQDVGRLYGRGTTDMKGYLASALALAERVGSAELSEPLSLAISYDEEVGCIGIRHMMPELTPLIGTPRAVIVGEPTSMQIAVGHKGKTALRVTCRGQSGHSALAPNFTNAIHVATDFVQQVRALQEQLKSEATDEAYSVPYSTVHVGRIEGGRALNIVPDEVQIDMEFRHLASVDGAVIRQKIDDAAQSISSAAGGAAQVTVEETNSYPGLDTPPDAQVVEFIQKMTGETNICKVPFGTEAGFFADIGLPVVVVGPGDMQRDGHKPDEGIDQSQLVKCDAMMDRLLLELSR